MNPLSKTHPLTGRTVLIPPTATPDLRTDLERFGARVLTWPKLFLSPPETCEPFDEAIANLFGYDWLIFRNINAVEFFLDRFRELGHEIDELDDLRLCGVGKDTVHKLEASQVHVDVIPGALSSLAAFSAIADYAGSREDLSGLNFLIPTAVGVSHVPLKEMLGDAGARADAITAYRTCSPDDHSITRLGALLAGGGVDSVAFTSAAVVSELANVFDTNDLGVFLTGVTVVCMDGDSAVTAAGFGLTADAIARESSLRALSLAIAIHFSR